MAPKLPIYMDNHATTPVDPRVVETMIPYFLHDFGNAASRNHAFGWKAEEGVEYAREQVAQLIDFEKPTVFCAARAVLGLFSVPAETPGAAFQLIVPIMLFVIALRFLGHGVHFTRVVLGGDETVAAAEHEEQEDARRQQAQITDTLAGYDATLKR